MDNIKNNYKKTLGDFGEQVAQNFLIEEGYNIIEKNFRFSRMGEIDIIAKHENTICFIEVKTRRSTRFGTGAESVVYSKRINIRRLAQVFMKKNRLFDTPIRFDVFDILIDPTSKELKVKSINHIKGAF